MSLRIVDGSTSIHVTVLSQTFIVDVVCQHSRRWHWSVSCEEDWTVSYVSEGAAKTYRDALRRGFEECRKTAAKKRDKARKARQKKATK